MAERTNSKVVSKSVSELWWLWVIESLILIIFGGVAMFWPGLTLVVLVYLVAPLVLAIGIIEVVRSLMTIKTRDTWWMSLIIGLLTFSVGVYLARHPEVSFGAFIVLIGITFIAWGVVDITRAFIDNLYRHHRALSFIGGISAVAAGIIVMVQPVTGGVSFVWVLGVFAVIYGIIALAFSIDHHRDYQDLLTSLKG